MTIFNSYKDYKAALAAGQRNIQFISSKPARYRGNGISSHLKHTVAAIQANELNGFC